MLKILIILLVLVIAVAIISIIASGERQIQYNNRNVPKGDELSKIQEDSKVYVNEAYNDLSYLATYIGKCETGWPKWDTINQHIRQEKLFTY
ncbi:MAG: hypothetical protein Q4F05_13590 [bacterium]|nr:hypothetical protein [bacterium]